VRGPPPAAGACPSCGAPLDRINMAGTCEYCGSHLTRGEFDWVLSKIEQDESYRG
jgi:predicted amidophosphoribosyltransferase